MLDIYFIAFMKQVVKRVSNAPREDLQQIENFLGEKIHQLSVEQDYVSWHLSKNWGEE